MSEFPEGWIKVPVDDVCKIVRGITFPTTDKRFEPSAGLIACLRTANVQANVEWDDLWFVPQHHVKNEEQLVAPDDILISTANSYELVGKVSRVTYTKFPSTLGAFISLLRAYKGVDAGFLYYQMSSENVQRSIREMSSTTTNISNVSGAKLKTLELNLAPSIEQTRIVEKLEELLSDLDAGVAELKAAQKKLAQYRQSLLKAAVEGALTAEWRANNPPVETGAQLLARILTERRTRWEAKQLAKFKEQGKTPPKDWQSKYPEPVQPDATNLQELPEGWAWATVEQLGNVQLGRQRSPSKIGKANPTPYIRAANITENGVDLSDVLEMEFSETEKETFALKVGDVLLTEASGSPAHVGRPAIWNQAECLYCFQNTVLRFSPEGIGSDYAFYLFLAMQKLNVFSKLSGGVGINHLSAGKFAKLAVPLPPVAEQLALVATIKEQFSLCDEQFFTIQLSLKQSTAQRQNILRAAFAGQLVAQDPNDEPASVLLERIRAEREQQSTLKKQKVRKTTQKT